MNYAQLRAVIQSYSQDFESSFVENMAGRIRGCGIDSKGCNFSGIY
jgi:hypothetical protein